MSSFIKAVLLLSGSMLLAGCAFDTLWDADSSGRPYYYQSTTNRGYYTKQRVNTRNVVNYQNNTSIINQESRVAPGYQPPVQQGTQAGVGYQAPVSNTPSGYQVPTGNTPSSYQAPQAAPDGSSAGVGYQAPATAPTTSLEPSAPTSYQAPKAQETSASVGYQAPSSSGSAASVGYQAPSEPDPQ